ncbi:MAG: 1-acyl-sn-glycerol-3-phosphate acyltransferase [Clostridiales bacterium]|nr:1-acyl-sn-glycerol-3-phosphate acyltransferase [Clostridiales bacterium]
MGKSKKKRIFPHQNRYMPPSTVASLCTFMYIMIVSNLLVSLPLVGGALYLCGRATRVFAYTFVLEKEEHLPKAVKWVARAVLGLILLACCFFLGIFPISPQSPMLWIIFGLVLADLFRDSLGKKILQYYVYEGWEKRKTFVAIAGVHFAALLGTGLILTYSLAFSTALLVWAGFLLCGLIELYDQWKNQQSALRPQVQDTDQMRKVLGKLNETNAYHAFTVLYYLYVIGLYLTIVLVCTYVVISAQSLFIYMLISFVCIIVSKEMAIYIGEKMKKSSRDPSFIGAVGTVCWLIGVVLFARHFKFPGQEMITYIAVAFSFFGASLCAQSLAIFEKDMEQVALFHMGEIDSTYGQMRKIGRELTNVIGETIVLVLLVILGIIEGFKLPQNPMDMATMFQPLLIFPALFIVIAVLIGMLQFPISRKYRQKLKRFLKIQEEGNVNEQMNQQLEEIVVKKHKRPFLLRVFIVLARPFYRHEVIGQENVPSGKDGQLIFISNHGSIYGPIATYLYLPFYVRPWSISDLMVSKKDAADYIYKYDISHWRWMPKKLRYPFARYIVAPLSLWLFRSIEAIPVYRNKPRELMNTFRLSLQAMMAEDNLLIFPENPDAKSLGEPGYVKEGAGELYTGFTMLASLLYNRTEKIVEFVPIYASREHRTITIGKPVVYDPENQPTQEKLRIAEALQKRMNEMAEDLGKDGESKEKRQGKC